MPDGSASGRLWGFYPHGKFPEEGKRGQGSLGGVTGGDAWRPGR